MSKIKGKVALVTGANRGIGRAFVEELLNAGVTRVYATARQPDTLKKLAADGGEKVQPLALDVTDANQVAALAKELGDVDLLINNAGVANFHGAFSATDDSAARHEMEVNYFGLLNVTRAFAPILKANGGGTIVNMGSVGSLVNFPALGSYCASKAAVYSLSQSMRAELAGQNTHVACVYPGPIDTDMAAGVDMDKTSPNQAVTAVLKGLEAGEEDIFPDPMALELRDQLRTDPKAVERDVGQMLPAA